MVIPEHQALQSFQPTHLDVIKSHTLSPTALDSRANDTVQTETDLNSTKEESNRKCPECFKENTCLQNCKVSVMKEETHTRLRDELLKAQQVGNGKNIIYFAKLCFSNVQCLYSLSLMTH